MNNTRSKLQTTRRTLSYSILLLALATLAMLASTGSRTFETLFNHHSLNRSSPAVTQRPSTTPESPNETRARLERSYGQLPLSFEANQGQTDPKVKFLSRGRDYTMFLTRGAETALLLRKPSPKRNTLHPSVLLAATKPEPEPDTPPDVVRMKLDGANPTPQVQGFEELPGKANYFIGNDPKKWRTNVPTYARVEYHAVYPGVDLVYYGNQQQLEDDFVLSPGTSPGAITLDFQGPEKLSLDAQGDLVLATKNGEARLQKPVCYQLEANGAREKTAGSYVLKGKNEVGFEIVAYDASKPLIIDPVLVYSTYLGGGPDFDIGRNIAVDSSGNAYVIGTTINSNFPTTSGAFRTTAPDGGFDAFVTKLNPIGSALVYSTYLGGSGGDEGNGITLDSTGSAYVTGETNSADFPTTFGAFQTMVPGNGDAFVTKLDPTGSALVYSTYLGGSNEEDLGWEIALDSAGSAYVGGGTKSTNFPTTTGAFQITFGGGNFDVFVTKLNAAGSAPLLYSTYLGGSSEDDIGGIAVDSAGSAYVTGATQSTTFPTTPGAFQTTFIGFGDAFVTKLNPTAFAPLVYSTFLGRDSSGGDIALDSVGNAYVGGNTASTTFPTTAGAFQTMAAGGGDAFVTKLNAAGSALVYSTYLGGSGLESGFGIALDSAGSAYVTGNTGSTDFPTTPDAFQTGFGGGTLDAYVTGLNPAGSALIFSSYLGGSNFDGGEAIAVDSAGSAYATGGTESTNFPTTPFAFQTASGGGEDAYVTKIGLAVGPSTPGKVTGGGFIQPDGTMSPATLLIQLGNNASVGDKATFGLVVQFNTGDTNPTGNLTYDDHAANVRIKALSYNLLFISQGPCGPNTRATFRGSATVTGPLGVSTQDFEVVVDDCGEPGSSPGAGPDMFTITTLGTTPYMATGPLVGGNIQVRAN